MERFGLEETWQSIFVCPGSASGAQPWKSPPAASVPCEIAPLLGWEQDVTVPFLPRAGLQRGANPQAGQVSAPPVPSPGPARAVFGGSGWVPEGWKLSLVLSGAAGGGSCAGSSPREGFKA